MLLGAFLYLYLLWFELATGLYSDLGVWTQIRERSPLCPSSSKAPSRSSAWSGVMREPNWALQKLSALEKVTDSLSN